MRMMWRGTNVRRVMSYGVVIVLLIYSIDFYFLGDADGKITHHAENYLAAKGRKAMLLDVPNCRIPVEIEPPAKVQSHPSQCDYNRPSITYVRANRIYVNGSFEGATCCYKGIIRKEGSDNDVTLTDGCVEIEGEAAVTAFDAVVVVCSYAGTIYDDYHAIVRRKSPVIQTNEAPSVLIIGLDSVSRFHYHNLLPKTKRVLDSLGSVEMMGYNKVGENTFPNAIAFLTGYEEDQVRMFCYNRTHPIDSCPFIWHNLKMTTALMEDAPRLAIFNYYRFGFFNPPTDHYLRPLMLSVLSDFYAMRNIFSCVGSRSTEAFMVDYIRELHQTESPLFLFTWLTSLAHEDELNLPRADTLFSDFFASQNLNNTIVVFMSDHGHRYGHSRRTYNGWYNEKLPFFTLVLPPKVKSFLGERRMRILESNTKKLTTPFDAYHTIVEILKLYKVKYSEEVAVLPDGQPFPRNRGQSLLTPIPETRTCHEAGIPKDFCACGDLKGMDIRNPLLEQSARYALSKINKRIPRRCSQLEVDKITGGAALNDKEFVVGFTTRPGGFHLETMGLLNGTVASYRVPRVSKITDAWCVNDWFLELYCHCSLIGLIREYVFGS